MTHLDSLNESPHQCNLVRYETLSSARKAFFSHTSSIIEPRNYIEASGHPLWLAAIDKELKALVGNRTWDLVDLSPGKKLIGNKWVFKVKLKSDGSLEHCKDRLVEKGFNQKFGIDYDETFSPVIKMTTIRFLIALAASRK